MNLRKEVSGITDELRRFRRDIHRFPEAAFAEFQTSLKVKEELERAGIECCLLEGGSGVIGLVEGEGKSAEAPGKNGFPAPVTALRAELDALPLQEKSDLPYRSENPGVMHACGHDGHAAVLVGVGKILAGMREAFTGTVKLLFQPAEETLSGARKMIEAGALENPRVERIVALHAWPHLEVGRIGLYDGAYMASADRFTIRVLGENAHGAYPHNAADAALAAAQVLVSLQTVVSREIDALDRAVLSVCSLEGGHAFNIIPREVTLTGTVRCHSADVRNAVVDKMKRIIEGVTHAHKCEYEFECENCVPTLVNTPEVNREIAEAAGMHFGEESVTRLDSPAMGSEDFSAYLAHVPEGALFRLGNGVPGRAPVGLHNDHFDFNDNALSIGVCTLVQMVLNRHS